MFQACFCAWNIVRVVVAVVVDVVTWEVCLNAKDTCLCSHRQIVPPAVPVRPTIVGTIVRHTDSAVEPRMSSSFHQSSR